MKVRSVHERRVSANATEIERLLATVASDDDRIWPRGWPRIRFDRGLVVGAEGGHGPIRYRVEEVTPSMVRFRFTPPRSGFAAGLEGQHSFVIEGSTMRHVLEGEAHGTMLLKWPLMIRPLHDALIQDLFDRVESELGNPPAKPARHSWWVRFLRWILR